MSRPRSRSPLYSRIPTLQGRRAEGLFGNQMRSSVQSDTWRNPEYVKVETNPHWNKDSHQGEQNVDHWAKFIDAIEHAQQRGPSPMARYPMQADEDRPSDSPRRLPRERLPSPEHTHYGVEEHYRMASPGWNRNEAFDKDTNLQHSQREMRDRSYPRHQERRSHDRMDYEYRNEEHGDQYHERGSYSESYLGYSSDRQLSLDLVNVGRQRLDFLPMLEHSGTYKESAVHCGTFAQEIITLVHQVKENYFSGQDIPLNERFANEQYYSIPDEIKEEEEYEDELEMENLRALMNRPQRMPSSGALDPLQRQQPVPDPGDLRYDLERRRQQKLEAVKITIAGANFTQMPSESQESEPPYMNDLLEEPDENFRWSEQEHEQQRQWDAPRQRMPEPTRQNIFNNDAPRQRMPAATRQNVFNNGSRQRKPEHPRQNFYPRGNRTGRQRGRRN
ncbi:uncharacterized protein isoform X3 [Danio rerio]|uniref:Uncharacterized protein isoform X3 n=1 Tax=Danio rerio TaxID=7955 RepID=A0AC58IQD5_DANRE